MHFFQTGGLNDLRQSTYVIDADKLLLKKFSLRLLNIDLQIYKNLVFMHTRQIAILDLTLKTSKSKSLHTETSMRIYVKKVRCQKWKVFTIITSIIDIAPQMINSFLDHYQFSVSKSYYYYFRYVKSANKLKLLVLKNNV